MIRELAEKKKNPIGTKTKTLANFFKIGTPPFVKPFSSPPFLNGPSSLSLSLKSLNLLLSLTYTQTLRSKWPYLCLHLRQCRRRILRRCNSHTDLNNNHHHHHHHNNCHPWRCPCLLLLLISTPLLATTRTAESKNPSASCAPSNSLFLSLFSSVYKEFVSLVSQSSSSCSFLSLYDRNDVRLIGLDDAASRLGSQNLQHIFIRTYIHIHDLEPGSDGFLGFCRG